MILKQKYRRFIIVVVLAIILLIILGLDEDRTIVNGVRHFLKAAFRAF